MDMTATTTTESTVEQTRKKYPVRRRATTRVAQAAPSFIATVENDASRRTRGALGKRLRQYVYGIYTDERTGITILNPGRTSEVLISQGGPTQESKAKEECSKEEDSRYSCKTAIQKEPNTNSILTN